MGRPRQRAITRGRRLWGACSISASLVAPRSEAHLQCSGLTQDIICCERPFLNCDTQAASSLVVRQFFLLQSFEVDQGAGIHTLVRWAKPLGRERLFSHAGPPFKVKLELHYHG